MNERELFKRVLPSIGPIIFRNVFILVNAVIIGVVILLFVFGNTQSGIFLGIVVILNTLLAVSQDIQARVTLEKLQMLTALRVTRIDSDGSVESVLAEAIKKGDRLKLVLGDQVPCDGVLVTAVNFEISEALITGESDSFSKTDGEKLQAGAIVTAGSGVFEVQTIFRESRLSRITEDVKKYAAHPSSIQRATGTIIKYSGYMLVGVIIFVVVRGIIVHQSTVEMIMNIGALASTIVPQGLVVVITLLFAIGAASYSKRQILFQEINATEKLGRIKNLCMDKTGTLTDTEIVVEEMHVPEGISKERAGELMALYIKGSGDSSQTIGAVSKFLGGSAKSGEVTSALSFSSWRQYGGVVVNERDVVLVGTPDIFIQHLQNDQEKKLLTDVLEKYAHTGKKILCAVHTSGAIVPKEISVSNLSVLSLFIFSNTLRLGIQNTVKFFQDRGIRIRILSGDSADTVSAVAKSAGVAGCDKVISGDQIEMWTDEDFEKYADQYAIFAHIVPEQKVRLIEAFKKTGFTAMVGDGVNDALAMKKADIGIAMFAGVPVTRQLAGVILMNNSFADLPGAVEMADNFIRSIEISAGIYVNQSLVGLLLFVLLSIFGFAYPLTPLNITFMNYFTVGLPGVLVTYWAIWPSGHKLPSNKKSFLARVMPFVVCLSVIEAIAIAVVFFLSPEYLKNAETNTLVMLGFIISGFIFMLLAPHAYDGPLTKKEKVQFIYLALGEIVLMFVLLNIPIFVKFFNITQPYPDLTFILKALLVLGISGLLQYSVAKSFFSKSS